MIANEESSFASSAYEDRIKLHGVSSDPVRHWTSSVQKYDSVGRFVIWGIDTTSSSVDLDTYSKGISIFGVI